MPLKILLADDSMTAQNLGKKILADAGHEVIAVSNGAAAVKKIAEVKPDIAILDVYMPGYTGLEVCERIRSAAATSAMPVLLTLGKMETGAFKQDDATRVKADGVIIKPFEASDLLAIVQKMGEKLSAVPPPAAEETPEYERTVKLNVAEMFKQDASYQEWQVSAPEHQEEEEEQQAPAKAKVEMSDEQGAAPAFGDMLGEEPPAPPQYAKAPTVAIEPVAEPIPLEIAPNTQQFAPPSAAPAPAAEAAHAPDPHFEPTVSQERIEVTQHAKDPALVTDPSEMASEFVTKFGVENAEPITVGVAADIPELYDDGAAAKAAAEAETPPAEAGIGELPTQDISDSVARMRAMEAAAKAEPEPPAAATATPDDEFEARVAAAMSAFEEPAASAPPIEAVEVPVTEADIAAAEAKPVDAIAPTAFPQAGVEPAPAVEVAPAAPEPPPVVVEEAPVAPAEAASLDHEMLKAFAAALPPAEPAPAPEPVVEAVEAAAVTEEAPPVAAVETPLPAPASVDAELAAAMAAAVEAEAKPMAAAAAAAAGGATQAIDPAKLAEAIHRALDRLKPDLIAHIAKELEDKK